MLRAASKVVLGGAALGVLLVAISLLAGCGGGSGDSTGTAAQSGQASPNIAQFGDQADPTDRVAMTKGFEEFMRARSGGDWERACSLLSASVMENLRKLVSLQPQLKKQSCPEQLKAVFDAIPETRLPEGRIRVIGARIAGDHGLVLYRDARGTFALPVTREGNVWKAGALLAQPLSG
jgi:hypothetical protein